MQIDFLYNEVQKWINSFPEYTTDKLLLPDEAKIQEISQEFLIRLQDNYPFHHPLYAGQMLKPPVEIAISAYLASMAINPNNHALDGGPATAKMEKEVIKEFSEIFGFNNYIGHLTTSGTLANLEALLIAREENPDKSIAFSDQAHYTHSRVCNWLRVPQVKINSNQFGQMDLEDLENKLKTENIGTVVATVSTTSLGSVDDIAKILKLKEKYNFRLHIDGAYGGYFKLISDYQHSLNNFDLIKFADSIAIDPHKQGLQPYGCGCVIFSDPTIGKHYKHESPYTYFTSDELHLGEISIECSRAGAAAAALWFTNKLIPLRNDEGLGLILKKTIDATNKMYEILNSSDRFTPYLKPETNIIAYYPIANSTSEISRISSEILQKGMDTNSLWLATLKVDSHKFTRNHPNIKVDSPETIILRSTIMKPEHYDWADTIYDKLIDLVENKNYLNEAIIYPVEVVR